MEEEKEQEIMWREIDAGEITSIRVRSLFLSISQLIRFEVFILIFSSRVVEVVPARCRKSKVTDKETSIK